jgi:hypothetical protein
VSPPFAEIVDWQALRDTVVFGSVAGIGITAAFGFLLLGSVRARENYSQGRLPLALLYGFVGLLGVAACASGIVFGLLALSES